MDHKDQPAVKIEWIRTLGVIAVALVGALGGWIANSPKADLKSDATQISKNTIEVRSTFFKEISDKRWTTAQCLEKVKRSITNEFGGYRNTRKYEKDEEKFEDQVNVALPNGTGFVLCQRRSNGDDTVVKISAGYASSDLDMNGILNSQDWKRLKDAIESVTTI